MIYKLLQSDDKDMFEPARSSSNRPFSKEFCKCGMTRKRKHFFYIHIISLWNSLSERTMESYSFKSNLHKDSATKPLLAR